MSETVVLGIVIGVAVVAVLVVTLRGKFRFSHGKMLVEAEGEALATTRMSIKAEGAAQVTNNVQRATRAGNEVLEIDARGDAVVDGNLLTDETSRDEALR
jgi:hypothetical protein